MLRCGVSHRAFLQFCPSLMIYDLSALGTFCPSRKDRTTYSRLAVTGVTELRNFRLNWNGWATWRRSSAWPNSQSASAQLQPDPSGQLQALASGPFPNPWTVVALREEQPPPAPTPSGAELPTGQKNRADERSWRPADHRVRPPRTAPASPAQLRYPRRRGREGAKYHGGCRGDRDRGSRLRWRGLQPASGCHPSGCAT